MHYSKNADVKNLRVISHSLKMPKILKFEVKKAPKQGGVCAGASR